MPRPRKSDDEFKLVVTARLVQADALYVCDLGGGSFTAGLRMLIEAHRGKGAVPARTTLVNKLPPRVI